MKLVAKYNTFKALSLAVTAGVPIATAAIFSNMFVQSTSTSISTAGVIALLIAALTFKDKLLEEIKFPTGFKISVALLIIILVIESIIVPMKLVLISACIAFGGDTLIFKRIYTNVEYDLPEKHNKYKHFGFIFCKTETLIGEDSNE